MKYKFYNLSLLLAFYILFTCIFYKLGSFGGDSTFPIIGGKTFSSNSTFLFMWMDNVLGTTSILEKLRGNAQFLFSTFNVFDLQIFFPIIASLGAFGFYKILSLSKNNTIENEMFKIALSLFFVLNPVTISHISQTFILQGYWIMPWVIYFYYKFLNDSKYLSFYLFGFLISVCFLGQPHNYYNSILLLLILHFYLLIDVKINFYMVIKKSILGFFFTLIVLSYITLPFVSSLPNDLTSSTSGFQGTEPNMIWSSFQGPINTFVFKSNIFDSNVLFVIYLICIIFLLFSVLSSKKGSNLIKNNKSYAISLMILFSLSFIAKNPFFSSEEIRQLIYTFIPHLRVDTTYITIAYIPMFLIFIYFGIAQHKKIYSVVVSIILCINILLLINYSYKETEKINVKEYLYFDTEIKRLLEINSTDTILFYPPNVTYKIDGLEKSNYPGILLNFEHKKSLYHWNFLEVSLNNTRNFINGLNSSNFIPVFLKNTDTKYIFCFNNNFDCNILKENKEIQFVSSIKNIDIFRNKNFHDRFYHSIDNFSKINPTNYRVTKKIFKNENIFFLQSFHPQWKIYLEPYSEIDCKNPNTYSGSINQKTENYTIQAGDDYQKIVASQSGVTQENLRELNPNIDEKELKIGQVITLKKSAGDSYNVTECESENKFYVGGELSKLWEKPIFEDTHTMVYDYANQWTLDPEYIKANYSKEYYRENPDGSIDVRMSLYFKPQSYFYLGLIISGTTLILLLSYLGYDVVRNSRRRNPKIDISRE